MSKTVPAAGGVAVSGTNIARACAEIILEHAPEGDRKQIDLLKRSMVEFCSQPDVEVTLDELAVSTIVTTIGTMARKDCIESINTGLAGQA